MEPINYLQAFQQYDFGRDIASGVQAGGAIAQLQQQHQQQQAAQQAQQQYMSDLSNYWKNPTAQGAAVLATKYPAQREAFQQAWNQVDQATREADYKAAVPFYAALQNGATDVAKNLLQTRIDALKNSGQPADTEQTWLDALNSGDPNQINSVKAGLGLTLSKIDPKFADNFATLGKERRDQERAPADLQKAQADAQSAAVAAKFAESNAALDLTKKGWDIKKVQNDIDVAKQNVRIAAQQASIARETNDLKRQELQIQLGKMIDERDEKVRTRTADVEAARNSMDNFLNTSDRLLALSVDKSGKPTDTLRAATGPVDSRFISLQTDVADLESLAETMKSQEFLAQVPALKGTGNLSDAEGKRLEESLASLSLRQSPEQFVTNVKEAQRLILKARKNLSTRYGVPDSVPDTPAAVNSTSPAEVDAILKKLGIN